MAFGFNLRNSLLGPAPQAHNVPQNAEGLRTPNGAMFNLGGFDPGPAPQVNLGDGQQGNISYSFKRTASSDPIANMMRDLQNPLGGLQVNVGQSQPAPQMPQGFAAGMGTPGGTMQQSPLIASAPALASAYRMNHSLQTPNHLAYGYGGGDPAQGTGLLRFL